MADFPFTPGMGSERIPRPSTKVDFDGDNAPRVRSLADEKYDYKIVLPCLSATDFATLQTFYDTNRLLVWNLTWAGGASAGVKFGQGRPKDKFLGNGVGYAVEITAHGV